MLTHLFPMHSFSNPLKTQKNRKRKSAFWLMLAVFLYLLVKNVISPFHATDIFLYPLKTSETYIRNN